MGISEKNEINHQIETDVSVINGIYQKKKIGYKKKERNLHHIKTGKSEKKKIKYTTRY